MLAEVADNRGISGAITIFLAFTDFCFWFSKKNPAQAKGVLRTFFSVFGSLGSYGTIRTIKTVF